MALAIGLNQEQFTFRMVGASRREDRIRITADWILAQFEQFYRDFLEVPHRARTAFEQQNHGTSIWLSRHRLSLYSSRIHRLGAYLQAVQPNISNDVEFLNCSPPILGTSGEDADDLFASTDPGNAAKRVLTQLSWLGSISSEGALFDLIGRKRA